MAKFDPDGNLIYSTLLGGDRITRALGIAVDDSGAAYVTGYTQSINFPIQNPIQGTLGNPESEPGDLGIGDAFLAKLSPDGSSLVYSTYLGGSGDEIGTGVAVDRAGDAFITGVTGSPDFPTANPLEAHVHLNELGTQPSLDAFVAKVNPSGTALVYSTYLGGSGDDAASAIALDAAGDAYVTGSTVGTGFPIANSGNLGGNFIQIGNAFVSELSPDGSKLLFSTNFGGGLEDNDSDLWREPGAIALDPAGDIYVAGSTKSPYFPTTANAFQAGPIQGGEAGFLVKFSPTDQLVYATYLMGDTYDLGTAVYGLAVDDIGDAYVVGDTSSLVFPTKDAIQPAHGDDQGYFDGFLTEFDPTGSALVASTYLGGGSQGDWAGDDYALGVALAAGGQVYVVGGTRSDDFPTTPGAFQTMQGGAPPSRATTPSWCRSPAPCRRSIWARLSSPCRPSKGSRSRFSCRPSPTLGRVPRRATSPRPSIGVTGRPRQGPSRPTPPRRDNSS